MAITGKQSISPPTMRISGAASASGVSKQTIEYYIMLGLIKPRQRKDKKGRFFDSMLVKRIKLIRELNESGYTLRDIREIYLKREMKVKN
jgi:DNA-binding transcriptional MerR regulator